MRFLSVAALALLGGLIFTLLPRERPLPTARALNEKTAMTGEFDLVDERPAPPTVAETPRAATSLEFIERMATFERVEKLEKMFASTEGLEAVDKAALIDAAFSLDDQRLIAQAERLALDMLNDGTESDMIAVLPKVSMFPENSPVHAITQESLCRFRGFGLEIVKLKYDRLFPNGRPWASVCRAG